MDIGLPISHNWMNQKFSTKNPFPILSLLAEVEAIVLFTISLQMYKGFWELMLHGLLDHWCQKLCRLLMNNDVGWTTREKWAYKKVSEKWSKSCKNRHICKRINHQTNYPPSNSLESCLLIGLNRIFRQKITI